MRYLESNEDIWLNIRAPQNRRTLFILSHGHLVLWKYLEALRFLDEHLASLLTISLPGCGSCHELQIFLLLGNKNNTYKQVFYILLYFMSLGIWNSWDFRAERDSKNNRANVY